MDCDRKGLWHKKQGDNEEAGLHEMDTWAMMAVSMATRAKCVDTVLHITANESTWVQPRLDMREAPSATETKS